MVASSDTIWGNMYNVLNLPLEHPIEVEPGTSLATLGEVSAFILALPEALKREEPWRAAAEAVVQAAKSRDTAAATVAVQMALILSGHKADQSAKTESSNENIQARAAIRR
jgi:hypothetical protein